MALDLVTGYKGAAHITAEDIGAFNAGIIGESDYVLNSGNKLSASLTSNNTVRILDGDFVIHGRHVTLRKGTYEDVTIENGESGMNRKDLIVARYTKDSNTGVEDVVFSVIKGAPTSGTAVVPEHTSGDILSGDCTLHEMPLYRIDLEGLTASEPKAIFEFSNNFNNYSRPDLDSRFYDEFDSPEYWEKKGNGTWQIPYNSTPYSVRSKIVVGSLINLVTTGEKRSSICQIIIGVSGEMHFRYTQKIEQNNYDGFSSWNKIHANYKSQISVGYYIGTGLSGSKNPNVLTFNFFPNFFLVRRNTDIMMAFRGESSAQLMSFTFGSSVSSSAAYLNQVIWDEYENKVSWYSESTSYGANHQSNIVGEPYFYFAF